MRTIFRCGGTSATAWSTPSSQPLLPASTRAGGSVEAVDGLDPAADQVGDVLAALEDAEERDVRPAVQAEPVVDPTGLGLADGGWKVVVSTPWRATSMRVGVGVEQPDQLVAGGLRRHDDPGWPGVRRCGWPTGRSRSHGAVQLGLGEERHVVDGDDDRHRRVQRHRVVRRVDEVRRRPAGRPAAARSAPRPAGPAGGRWPTGRPRSRPRRRSRWNRSASERWQTTTRSCPAAASAPIETVDVAPDPTPVGGHRGRVEEHAGPPDGPVDTVRHHSFASTTPSQPTAARWRREGTPRRRLCARDRVGRPGTSSTEGTRRVPSRRQRGPPGAGSCGPGRRRRSARPVAVPVADDGRSVAGRSPKHGARRLPGRPAVAQQPLPSRSTPMPVRGRAGPASPTTGTSPTLP